MSTVIDHVVGAKDRGASARVPAVTASFWVTAVLGTACADGAVSWWTREARMGVGPLAVGITLTLGVFAVAKFRATRATPLLYWAVLAIANLAGVAYARVLTDVLQAPPPTASMFLALLLVSLLGTWLVDEGAVSQASVTSASRELSYWAAWMTSAALGSAITEWLLVTFRWGSVSTITAGLVFALVVLAGRSVGVAPTLCFWVGAVAIRPLGTSTVDWLASSPAHGGVGFGVGMASLICLASFVSALAWTSGVRRHHRHGHRLDRTIDLTFRGARTVRNRRLRGFPGQPGNADHGRVTSKQPEVAPR